MTVTLRSGRLKVACLAALIAMPAVGCASGGSGPQFALNPKRVALREQLSRLEYQNQQLKDELAVAQQDSRRLSNDLQLAEINTQDLERRLDSFRTQLGLNSGSRASEESIGSSRPYFGDDPGSGSTRPASQLPNRSAPFTRIPNPGRLNDSPPPGPSIENRARERYIGPEDSTISPRLDLPPVRYFDLNPSAGRRALNEVSQASNSSTWSPLNRGSTARLARGD